MSLYDNFIFASEPDAQDNTQDTADFRRLLAKVFGGDEGGVAVCGAISAVNVECVLE